MDLVLNIYKGREIEKTYRTDTYDLMFGTVEDILSIAEISNTNNTNEILMLVQNAMGKLKPFLKDIFEGLTDDELRRTKVKELIKIFIEIFQFSFHEIGGMGSGKN